MARSSVLSTIDRVRRQLAGSGRTEVVTLGGAGLTDVQTSFEVDIGGGTLPAAFRPGAVLAVDGELVHVTDTFGTGATVIRGWWDSTPAAHLVGTPVWINPRYSPMDVLDAMIDEINSWGPQLYRVAAQTFPVTAGATSFELPALWAGTFGIVNANRLWTGWDALFGVDINTWPKANVRLTRSTTAWTAATTSGLYVRIWEDGPIPGGSVNLTVALPFDGDLVTLTADLVTDVGLQPSMLDLLDMGVKHRVRLNAEDRRTARSAADDPRRAEEVPVGAALQTNASSYAYYRQRMQQEINKLRDMYPYQVIA